MSEILRAALRTTWTRNRDYAKALVGDLAPAQFVVQPAPGRIINHPAWILCHLNVYSPVMTRLLKGERFDDPLGHPFGRGSKVTTDLRDYPEPASIVEAFVTTHNEALAALDSARASVFEKTNPLARWVSTNPTVGEQLVNLMIKHESFHLGQLSAWRRAMGMSPVEM